MALSGVILSFIAMLLLALLLEPLARLARLPFTAALVTVGFAGSQLIVGAGIDTGLRWQHFHDLVFFVFLPALIFESAFAMDARLLMRNLAAVLLLALPILLLTTVATAALLYLGIGHPTGFPWSTALICGALLAASEPIALTELAHRLPIPRRLLVLMEGESLFNDATTIVLFTLLVAIANGRIQQPDLTEAGTEFVWLFVGGLLTGGGVGLVAAALLRYFEHAAIVTLLAAYGSYLCADVLFGFSGVMASLASGLITGAALRRYRAEHNAQVEHWWAQLGWIANSALFVLAGATFTLAMFEERWLAMLIGIVAVLLTRWLGIGVYAALFARIPGVGRLPPGYAPLMSWGGLRGAITLALALALPTEVEAWWTVQSIAYGVVLFALLVQAPTTQALLSHLQRRGAL